MAGPRVSSPLWNNPVFESSFVPLTYIVQAWIHRDPIARGFLGCNSGLYHLLLFHSLDTHIFFSLAMSLLDRSEYIGSQTFT